MVRRALNLPFQAALLRLRVERVVDRGVLTIGLGLGRLLLAGGVGAAARLVARVLGAPLGDGGGDLDRRGGRLGAPLEPDAGADVEAGVGHGEVHGDRRRGRVRRGRGRGLGRHRLDLGDLRAHDRLGRRRRLGRLGLLLLVLDGDRDGAAPQLALLRDRDQADRQADVQPHGEDDRGQPQGLLSALLDVDRELGDAR